MAKRTPKEVVSLTKSILTEAGEFFNKEPYAVTCGQFLAVSNGRLGMQSIERLGVSYGVMRSFLFPSDNSKAPKEMKEMLNRILKNVQK